MESTYEYTPLYYGTPCQVRFYDGLNPAEVVWHGGIAYQDYIICGCCGMVLPIQEVIDDGVACGLHWDDVIVELEWLDVSEAIRGKLKTK